jgi:Tfp pilus assembly protein PilF
MTLVVTLSVLLGACSSSSPPSASSTSSSIVTAASFDKLIGAGITLLGEGNVDGAFKLFRRAVASDPASPLGYYNLGVVYQKEDDPAQAVDEYDNALVEDPSYVPAIYNKAVIYGSAQPQQAMNLYRRVLALQPHSPTALLNLGLLEVVTNGMEQQGIIDLRHAVVLDPSLRAHIPPFLRARVGAT